MLIFDRFRDLAGANAFKANCSSMFGKSAEIFLDDNAAFVNDPFPYELDPPIVHVERDDDIDVEQQIIRSVALFQGEFAGT